MGQTSFPRVFRGVGGYLHAGHSPSWQFFTITCCSSEGQERDFHSQGSKPTSQRSLVFLTKTHADMRHIVHQKPLYTFTGLPSRQWGQTSGHVYSQTIRSRSNGCYMVVYLAFAVPFHVLTYPCTAGTPSQLLVCGNCRQTELLLGVHHPAAYPSSPPIQLHYWFATDAWTRYVSV